MADTYPRTNAQLVDASHREVGPAILAEDPGYTCSLCGSDWPYQAVRYTGRCPTCGSGLLREN